MLLAWLLIHYQVQAKPMTVNIKQALSNKIKLCLKDRVIPADCQTLVMKLWPSALYYLLKNHGEHNPQWNNAINMYLELIDSIQPLNSIEQLRRLKTSYMAVARNNNNMLLLYHAEYKVEPAIKSLITYFNSILGSARTELEKTPTSGALDKIAKLPANIKPGVWCEIYIDDKTPVRRLRLSIINMDNGQLIFVNRNGIKMLEKDAEIFARELRSGQSKVYKHDALFIRTTGSSEFQKIG